MHFCHSCRHILRFGLAMVCFWRAWPKRPKPARKACRVRQDFAIIKETKIGEQVKFQLRGEFFNLWNWHIFNTSGSFGSTAFTRDLASPDFGKWNGSVSTPRTVQVGVRLVF